MKNRPHLQGVERSLHAAILMALATPVAVAGVTTTQLPGVGYVVKAGYSTTFTSAVTASTDTLTVKNLTGPTVIQWGGSPPDATAAPTINAAGTAGFDIGSSATVDFLGTGSAGTNTSNTAASVLNIDASGNPSTILGHLSATNTSVFVANANGIVVGSGAVINTPAGLGLINANLNTKNAIEAFNDGGNPFILFSPSGASGGISIASDADLNQVGTFLDVAGAGNVNINGGFVNQANSTVYNLPATGVTVVAGMAGTFVAGTYAATDAPFGTQNSLLDSTTGTVNLNLGTGTHPYAGLVGGVVANGDINLAAGSNLTDVNVVNAGTLEWTGTLTNEGIINFGSQTGSTLTPTANEAYFAPFASAGTTSLVLGSLVNASGGVINGGNFNFKGAAFSNTGTIQLGQASKNATPYLDITATTGNINLAGTISVVAAANEVGATPYTGSLSINQIDLDAASVANQSVIIDSNPLTLGFADILATNVNISSSLNVTSEGSFYFTPYGSAAPISGAFTLASGAEINAFHIFMGANVVAHYPDYPGEPVEIEAVKNAYTSYTLNGNLIATGSNTYSNSSVTFGAIPNTTGSSLRAEPFNIQGAGSITTGNLTINDLQGSMNNITTGQILANGFQLNAPSGEAMNIAVTANGAKSQGFNVKVNGSASVSSGDTVAVDTKTSAGDNNYTQYLFPANANSNLVVQASGALFVEGGDRNPPYPTNENATQSAFQWPGLVYLQSNGGDLIANTPIVNAYGAQAKVGAAGVFLIANNITDNFPIYTNGNSGVVFAAPFNPSVGTYGYAESINGVNPQTTTALPSVYFAQANTQVDNTNLSLQPLGTFTNENGYQQENQTFLTLAQAK